MTRQEFIKKMSRTIEEVFQFESCSIPTCALVEAISPVARDRYREFMSLDTLCGLWIPHNLYYWDYDLSNKVDTWRVFALQTFEQEAIDNKWYLEF